MMPLFDDTTEVAELQRALAALSVGRRGEAPDDEIGRPASSSPARLGRARTRASEGARSRPLNNRVRGGGKRVVPPASERAPSANRPPDDAAEADRLRSALEALTLGWARRLGPVEMEVLRRAVVEATQALARRR
jgi:hypothetical protein